VSAHSSVARLSGEVPKFDVVEAVTPVGAAPCFECRGPIVDTYYERGGHVICVACQRRLAASVTHATGEGRFPRALAFGLGAAALGTTIYLGLVAVTGREIELVLILVGFMVGRAVRHGSGGRGGRRYQWLAVALTYLAIAGTYAPFVMRGFGSDAAVPADVVQAEPAQSGALLAAPMSAAPPSTPALPAGAAAVGAGALLMLAAAAPALAGLGDIADIAITLAALAVAWRTNRRTTLEITGPYFVRQASGTTRHR
jgi:hypothetical protein